MPREDTPLGRFEIICEAYLYGGEDARKTILSHIPTNDRKTFLKGVGLYHLLTNKWFFDKVCDAMEEQFRKEVLRTKEAL